MTGAICEECGRPLSGIVKFCPGCGAERGVEKLPPTPHSPTGPAAGLGSGEFRKEVRRQLDDLRKESASQRLAASVRGYFESAEAKAILGAALIGIGVTIAISLILALFMPNTSLLDLTRGAEDFELKELSLLREILILATGASLAGLEVTDSNGASVGRVHPYPILMALIPIFGTAFGVDRTFRGIAERLDTRGSLVSLAGVAISFSVLMMVLVLLGADWKIESELPSDNETGAIQAPWTSVLMLSFLWGFIGAAIGLTRVLRSVGVGLRQQLPVALSRAIYRGSPAAYSLLLLLAITSVIGAAVWTVQSIREAADARLERSLPASVFDSVVYGGDLGIRYAGLGALASFEFSDGIFYSSEALSPQTPIPITRGNALQLDYLEPYRGRDRLRELGQVETGTEGERASYGLLDFEEILGAAFVPFAIALVGLAGLLALYAGFLTAARRNPSSAGGRAAWGALVGPVWAVLIFALDALSESEFYGNLIGESVLVTALLGGAVLGALGGLLASSGRGNGESVIGVPTH